MRQSQCHAAKPQTVLNQSLLLLSVIISTALLQNCGQEDVRETPQVTAHAQRMDQINAYIDQGETSKAQAALQEAFDTGYQHPMAYYLQGRIHMAAGTRAGAAASIPWFEKAIAASPNWYEPRALLAQACIRDSRLQRARQVFSDIDRIYPRAAIGPYGMALIASLNGQTETCIALLDEALDRFPEYGPALLLRAQMARKQGDELAERRYFERYIVINPLDPAAHSALGRLAERSKRYADARRAYERSYELRPDPDTARRLAELAARRNDAEERALWLKRAGAGSSDENIDNKQVK